jgi:glycolate oxidase FAD binding subunit
MSQSEPDFPESPQPDLFASHGGHAECVQPETADQMAEALHAFADQHQSIRLGGNFSKQRLGTPADEGQLISTVKLRRVREYEPRDLTIRVEAGMLWTDLEQVLDAENQMLPLDPGWQEQSTVGGVIAANLSGPRRRLYGTARDMVIGMTFATLEGKLIQSGGMVVKNVAGLDMAKLMIGSFGTLAAITSVNFRVYPKPPASRTFVLHFETPQQAFAERDQLLKGAVPPTAIDIINFPSGYRLLAQFSGNHLVIERITSILSAEGTVETEYVEHEAEQELWRYVREYTARFLTRHPQGIVIPVRSGLAMMAQQAELLNSPGGEGNIPWVARAGSGVIYAHYANGRLTDPHPAENEPRVKIDDPAGMMRRVKQMFDPENLLNRGRLYGY